MCIIWRVSPSTVFFREALNNDAAPTIYFQYINLTRGFKKFAMLGCRGHWYKTWIRCYKNRYVFFWYWNVKLQFKQLCIKCPFAALFLCIPARDLYQTDMFDAVFDTVRDGLVSVHAVVYGIWKFCGSSFCGLSFAVFSVHGSFYVCHMLTKLNSLDILEAWMSQKRAATF